MEKKKIVQTYGYRNLPIEIKISEIIVLRISHVIIPKIGDFFQKNYPHTSPGLTTEFLYK